MTHADLAKAMAAVVKDYVRAERAQLETRLAVLEATTPPLHKSLDSLLSEGAAVRERVAILEARPPLPGPPGEPGPPGKDGADGTPGLTYQGVFVDGKAYQKGDVATWAGSMWHANTATTSKPGDGSKDWTLACKHGRDGRDK